MIIKDEIHGTVEFTELEERIIDSHEFQRLRRIKQMSVTNLVYPGANHSRFEHSIGTAHLSQTICRRLGLEEDLCRKVKLYGLLHDVGHTPFSHEGEDVLKRHVGDHEELGGRRMVRGEIADIVSESYDPREIADLGKSRLGSIVSSDLGADRMDYLKRDALNTGVAYGIIDIDRIVHTLGIDEKGLFIRKGGLEAAEYLLVARFMMFSTVYMHRTVRIATAMLYRAIEGAIVDGTVDPAGFAALDDEAAMALLLKSGKGGAFARGLSERRLYKEVFSFPKEGLAEEDARSLEGDLGGGIIVDYPHKFFKPIGLRVQTDGGHRPIIELSKLVESLERAESERMKVLVLGDEGARSGRKDEIERSVRAWLRKRRH